MQSTEVIYARIYRETVNQLDSFSRRVQEGRDLEAASNFARWLSFSGILMLLEAFPEPEPFKVDGRFLRWKCEQLIEAVNLRYRTNNSNPSFEAKDFESMHEKIDRMAGYLSRLSVAPAVTVNPLPQSAVELNIISGGLDDGGRNEPQLTPATETVNQRP
jgi:hypothetical protein